MKVMVVPFEAPRGASDELRTCHEVVQQIMLTPTASARILADSTAQEKSARTQVQQAEENPSAASQRALHFVREVAENKGFLSRSCTR
ncbi:hypothetical protein [Dyella solisilvae]|uniref:hypothetical protein n=1 Tax=Dyella solisilvae TaxID=1920168 RepID=UPI0011C0479F|nr:hypothetical protein [Dyella solisilvae]